MDVCCIFHSLAYFLENILFNWAFFLFLDLSNSTHFSPQTSVFVTREAHVAANDSAHWFFQDNFSRMYVGYFNVLYCGEEF